MAPPSGVHSLSTAAFGFCERVGGGATSSVSRLARSGEVVELFLERGRLILGLRECCACFGEIVADGGETAGSFGGARKPFVAVARECEAGGRGALRFTDESIERGCGCAFCLARAADLFGELCQHGAVAIGGRGREC